MAEYRIIHTNLFSSIAKETFTNFFKYMREHNNGRMYRNTERVFVEIAPDGEILLKAYLSSSRRMQENGYYQYFHRRSIWDRNLDNDTKPKEWLAIAIKHQVISSTRSDGNWRRNNTDGIVEDFATKDPTGKIEFAPTVAWLYCIYDHLLERKSLEKKYGADLIKEVVGTRRDPMITEMELSRRNRVECILKEFSDAKEAAKSKHDRLLKEYNKELEKIEAKEIAAATEARDKALKEVEEAMKNILAMSQV